MCGTRSCLCRFTVASRGTRAVRTGPEAGQQQQMKASLHSPQALLGFLSGASEGQGSPQVSCQLFLKGPQEPWKAGGQFAAGRRASSEGH